MNKTPNSKALRTALFLIFIFSGAALQADAPDRLPANLKWQTNETDPTWGSPAAKKGGVYHASISSFPLTLRYVGPDSNGSFRGVVNGNRLSLTSIHPNTDQIIPELATHWAYHKDGRTVFYKLNPKARWSDGKPVTADDFIFTLEFMRSKHITAPWYNEYYGEHFIKVAKYDRHTIAVEGKNVKPKKDLHYYYGMTPTPKHFYKLDKNFVKNYNWKIIPNTGPYQISKINKGKNIILKRKKNWWAKDLRYNKNRYNVDRVQYRVIRDVNVAYEHFEKGELDTYGLIIPDLWHNKSKGALYDNGYIHKIWFYYDAPQADYGIWLNQDVEIFKDKNVRYAFAHAMNVKKVLKNVLRGDYERLQNGSTGYAAYTNKKVRARTFDLKKVDRYMKLAGWQKRGKDGIRIKNGKRFAVRVTYGAKHHTDRLVVLKEEAKKAGIELKLQLLDSSASFKTMLEKKHEVAWSAWGAMYRPQYWGQYHSKNAHKPQTNNFSNTDNPKLDKLIDQYREELNEPTKIKLAHKIQALIHEEGAYIPTFLVPYTRHGYWNYWKLPDWHGTKTSGGLFGLFGDGGFFWFDEKAHKATKKAMKSGKKLKPVTITDKNYKP